MLCSSTYLCDYVEIAVGDQDSNLDQAILAYIETCHLDSCQASYNIYRIWQFITSQSIQTSGFLIMLKYDGKGSA